MADAAIYEDEATVIVLVYINLTAMHRAGVDEIIMELDFHRAAVHFRIWPRQLVIAHPIAEVLHHEAV